VLSSFGILYYATKPIVNLRVYVLYILRGYVHCPNDID